MRFSRSNSCRQANDLKTCTDATRMPGMNTGRDRNDVGQYLKNALLVFAPRNEVRLCGEVLSVRKRSPLSRDYVGCHSETQPKNLVVVTRRSARCFGELSLRFAEGPSVTSARFAGCDKVSSWSNRVGVFFYVSASPDSCCN